MYTFIAAIAGLYTNNSHMPQHITLIVHKPGLSVSFICSASEYSF